MADVWNPKRLRLERDIDLEGDKVKSLAAEDDAPFWQKVLRRFVTTTYADVGRLGLKGLDYAALPFTLTGILQKHAQEEFEPSATTTEIRPLVAEGQLPTPIGGGVQAFPPPQPSAAFVEQLPGGRAFEEYFETTTFGERLSLEAPAIAGSLLIPAAAQLRAALAPTTIGKGLLPRIAQVARGALAPVEALEAVPALAVKGVKQTISKVQEVTAPLKNKFPYQLPEMTPFKSNQQIKLVASELTETLGKVKRDFAAKTTTAQKKGILQSVKESRDSFLARTYRIEQLLDKMDGFLGTGKFQLRGGKFSQAIWQPVNRAKDQALRELYGAIGSFRSAMARGGINPITKRARPALGDEGCE